MTSGVRIPIGEYLRTPYHPDRDYVDGEVWERNPGELEHSSAQREILLFLATHYPALRRLLQPEQRVQIGPNRFHVPDICILAAGAPRESVVRVAPALCIEILSPEDTLTRTLERVKDYLSMGVPVCWILDPIGCVGWTAVPGRLEEAMDGVLRADGIEMPIAEVLI